MARVSMPVLLNRGCTALFLLPFVSFGMFVLVKGIRSLVNGDMSKGEAIGMVAFGAVFATIPLGVIALMAIGAKHKKKAQSIRSAHRENPWLSKKEWVEGRIRSGPRAPVFSIWAFSLAFSGFCIPIILNFLSLDGDKILWLKSSWILGLFVAWVVVGLCEDEGSYEQEEFSHDGA